MWDARTAGRFPTRRPKARPSTVAISAKSGERFEAHQVPAGEAIGFLHLPTLEPPAFLTGRPKANGVRLIGVQTIGFGRPLEEVTAKLQTNSIQATTTLDLSAFARMLAKIGYSTAVAIAGTFPRCEAPVLPLILGKADDGGTWLGSVPYVLPIEDRLPQHVLALVEGTVTVDGRRERVWTSRVKLFCNAGAIGYEVVVRRFIEPGS
jgi:hypothetical protein